jgi:predicted solute-binding protein
VLIEGDGLGDCRPNKKKFAEKLKLYQDNNLKYIIINYDEDINLKLSFLLKYYSHINKKLEDFNAKQVSTLC